MANETKIKPGDKVTIRVKRGKKAVTAKPKTDRRYGPPPLGEDKKLLSIPQVTVHDMTQIFEQVKYRERLSNVALTGSDWFTAFFFMDEGAGDIFRWTEMMYNRARLGWIERGGTDPRDELTWTEVISQSLLRGQLFNDGGGDQRPDPDHVPNQPVYIFDEVDVFNIDAAEAETNYRKNDKCWPIPKEASGLGLKMKIGTKPVEVGGSGWGLKPQKSENKEAELNDLSLPVATGVNAWARGKRDDYSKPGAFRSAIDRATFPIEIQATGHFYESFKTDDTTNFKVTKEPSYTAEEVSGRFLIGLKRVKVFVVPQLWAFSYNNPGPVIEGGAPQTSEPCTLYDFARTLPPQKWYRYKQVITFTVFGQRHAHRDSLEDYNSAFGTSYPSAWHFYEEKLDYLNLPIAVSDYPYITNDADQIALIAANQRSRSMTDAQSLVHYETVYGIRNIARGNLTVTNTQTVAGRLVGAIQTSEESKFYVWRKTDTEREIINLYSGKTTPIDSGAFDGSSGSNIWIYSADDTIPQPSDIPALEQYFFASQWGFNEANARIPPEDW